MREDKFVNAFGQPINPFHTPSALAAKPKAKRQSKVTGVDHQDTESLGFTVEGWVADAMIEAKRVRMDELAAFAANPVGKQPLEWDEEAYFQKVKPKRICARPYEIASSADACAEIATKAGFLRVRVREVRRPRKG